jgi:hypothetical protein
MASSSLRNDSCSYEEKLRVTTGPGMYMLGTPSNDCGNDCSRDIPADPYFRYQKFGQNTCPPGSAVDDGSELEGLNYRTTKCSKDQYLPGKYSAKGACSVPGTTRVRSCLPPTEDTRLSNPACTLRSTGWNRWEWLCWNPQDRALVPFEREVSYRIVAKDNHAPCFEMPLDDTPIHPNGTHPDNVVDQEPPTWTPPADCNTRTNMQTPYFTAYDSYANVEQL